MWPIKVPSVRIWEHVIEQRDSVHAGRDGKAKPVSARAVIPFAVELEGANPCIIMHSQKMLVKEPYILTRISGMHTKCMAATAIVITMGTLVPCAFAQAVMIP